VAQQSLYRRYRPRRFSEVRGQDHVITALRNSVRSGTEGQAYLFSGPRGTGKTSTARILAKALNCEDLRDGEPCCECGPCVEMEAGRSFDLFELDAASHGLVEDIRDLIQKAAVGSPGRTKVYILDEVHMLKAAASNALLKTLEEPPDHVCFVLATTDPQKLLPTIRSRTQHYEFQLLSADQLTDYVHWIDADAGLGLDEASVAHVVRQGRGSARDTLSALDQVVAAGGVISREAPVDQLMRALTDRDSGGAVRAVSDAISMGHDPRVLAERFLAELRDSFLFSLGVEVTHLVDADRDRIGEHAAAMGTAMLTRSMEAVGSALVDMRNAADPRVPLEVALVRLCSSAVQGSGGGESDGSDGVDARVVADLRRRVEELERAIASSVPKSVPSVEPASSPTPSQGSSEHRPEAEQPGSATSSADGPARARAALDAKRKKEAAPASDRRSGPSTSAAPSAPRRPEAPRARSDASRTRPAPATTDAPPAIDLPSERSDAPVAEPAASEPRDPSGSEGASRSEGPPDRSGATRPTTGSATESGTGPDRDALALAFGDVVVPSLRGVAKAVYGAGRFVSVSDTGAVFALENAPTRDRAESFRPDVEAALSAHFGVPLRLVLVDGSDPHEAASDAPVPAQPVQSAQPVADGPSSVDGETADDDESAIGDVHELEDADVAANDVERLTRAFPGATLLNGAEGAS